MSLVAHALCLAGALFAFGAYGQAPPQSPAEVTTRDAPATFRAGTNLVLVPVVVRDRAGKAIGTLKQEDFQLTDKAKPQVITRFSIERPEAPIIPSVSAVDPDAPSPQSAAVASPIPQRFVAYLVDDVHLNIADLTRVRLVLVEHLTESLEPATRAAVFTTSGRTTLDFTDNRDQLRDTLNRIQPWTSAQSTAFDCPNITYYMADLIVNKNDQQALAAATAEALACNPPPGSDPASMRAAQAQAQNTAQAVAQQQLSTGDQETRLANGVLRDVVRRISVMPGSRNIILASSGYIMTIDHRADEADLMDRAIRANTTISSLDARGVYNPSPEADASRPGGLPSAVLLVKSQYERDSALAGEDIMAELADGTGGTFFHNDNDLRAGLKRLAAQPDFVYILGFSPQNLKLDGSFHLLKVTLKNHAGLSLQARRGYYAPKHAADPEEEAKEEIREAVFSREEMSEIPVELNMQFFKPSDLQAKLSVIARVDIRKLRYRKVADRNNNTLTVVSGVFDRNGNFVSGVEKIVELRLRDETMAKLPAAGINIRSTFDVPPGAYVLRLVVRDGEGQTMAARNGAVQIP